MWRAVTALSIATITAVAVGFIYAFSQVMAFLQPILVPFAIAGVLAYLLEPAVSWLVKVGTTRQRAVIGVFAVTTLALAGVMFWIIPLISTQTARLARKVPEMTRQVRVGVAKFGTDIRDKYGLRIVPDEFLVVPQPKHKAEPAVVKPEVQTADPAKEAVPAAKPAAETPAPSAPTAPAAPSAPAAPAASVTAIVPAASTPAPIPAPAAKTTETPPEELWKKIGTGDWINDALPTAARKVWDFLSSSLGGFLGFFGFLLSLVIVPLYLFYFLTESPHIAKSWSKYLPLRASEFKDEVVAALTEINGYLIAFFRGQLIVSIINGTVTGALLAAAGLDFGILIGFGLCFLGIIPYIGIVLCWIPAVIIASVQGGSWLVPMSAAWWVFPLVVTGIFTIVQQVDGLFITPKIVGERVGLHPVTVIFSVFLWTTVLGGLLGAILAVPLTATAKVILKRYVWERTIMAEATVSTVPISEK